MRLKGFKRPKIERSAARDTFFKAVVFRSIFAVFIVKANKKFSICKLLQKEAKIMRARAWFRAPAFVRVRGGGGLLPVRVLSIINID